MGEVLTLTRLSPLHNELAKLASAYPGALVVMEAGTHSPWISRFLDSLGMEIVVANPRKTRTISQSERKSDSVMRLFWPVLVGWTATSLVQSSTAAKRPNMTYFRSNCETAWCGRGVGGMPPVPGERTERLHLFESSFVCPLAFSGERLYGRKRVGKKTVQRVICMRGGSQTERTLRGES